MDLTAGELKKIEQLDDEIREKNEQLAIYAKKAEKIEKKVLQMKKFDTFLEIVKDANQDMFGELQDIISRHKQLKTNNEELHNDQERYT